MKRQHSIVLATAALGFALSACHGTIDSVTATPGDGVLHVSWSSTGRIDSFDVEVRQANQTPTPELGNRRTSPPSSRDVTGLKNGTTYTVTVFGWVGQEAVAQASTTGTPQANLADAGGGDAGAPDAGAGVPDAGAPDAGALDAGRAWALSTTGDTRMRDLSGVWGSSATDVYVVGLQGAAYHSADRGASWQAVSGLPADQYSGIWGTAANNIYVAAGVVGSGTLYHFDGGSWAVVSTNASALASVWGSSATDVYAVGANGTILHATDGLTFAPQASGTGVQLVAVGGAAGDVYVVGGDGNPSTTNTILHSTTGGATWTAQTPVTAATTSTAVWSLGGGKVLVATQDGALTQTTTGGTTWAAGPTSPANTAGFYALWGSSPTNVYVAGATTLGPLVARYDGTTLTPVVTTPDVGNGFSALWGTGATDVYAVGSAGTIAHGP